MGSGVRLVVLLASAVLGATALPAEAVASSAPIRVVAYEVEPYIYRVDGKPAGLEYEILEYLAKAIGRTIEVDWVDRFEEVLPRLERGEADVASATITITPARQERFDFSGAYMPVRVILIEGSDHNTTDLEMLRGSTLATIRGTTYESLLEQVPEAKLLYAGSEPEQFELVASGRARALAVDSAVAFHQLRNFPGLRLGMALGPEQGFGFAFRKGSPLTATFSRFLIRLKESNIYYPLVQKHLGKEAVQAMKTARSE